jgi:hypothetical protein
MAKVKLTEHLGTEIFVDSYNGKFSARLSNGYEVEERVLSTLKKAIEKDEPCVQVMYVETRYVSARKETMTRSRLYSMIRRQTPQADEDPIEGYAELDEGLIQRMKEIDGDERNDLQMVRDKYDAIGREVLASVPDITIGRMKELLDEDAKAKAARR